MFVGSLVVEDSRSNYDTDPTPGKRFTMVYLSLSNSQHRVPERGPTLAKGRNVAIWN
jgi:hypothetical protein